MWSKNVRHRFSLVLIYLTINNVVLFLACPGGVTKIGLFCTRKHFQSELSLISTTKAFDHLVAYYLSFQLAKTQIICNKEIFFKQDRFKRLNIGSFSCFNWFLFLMIFMKSKQFSYFSHDYLHVKLYFDHLFFCQQQ